MSMFTILCNQLWTYLANKTAVKFGDKHFLEYLCCTLV